MPVLDRGCPARRGYAARVPWHRGRAARSGLAGGVAIGDSKRPDRPELRYIPSEFAAFNQGVKAGEFDHLLSD
ncbi:DUF397 domain-containing protein [Streptomyces sp. NPDC000941]